MTAPAVTAAAHDDRYTQVRLSLRSDRGPSGQPVSVFVNGGGAHLIGGYEDAAAARSSIVWGSGFSSIDVPAYAGGAQRWGQVMSCVEQQFAEFDVVITDERPAGDDFIMLMVGGSPRLIGEGNGVAGIAPFSGTVIPGAVGFAFSEALADDPREVCETVAHEIGHILGLDHTHECTDTMSYLYGCGDKSFQDLAMSCGEWDPRSCGGGSTTQNSFAQLVAAVGLRSDERPIPPAPAPEPARPPTPTPTPEPDPEPEGWDGHWRDDGWDHDDWDESADDGYIEWTEPSDWDDWVDGEWVWVDWVEWVEWDGSSGCD